MDSSGNAAADFGRFLTGFLVLMGIGMSMSPPQVIELLRLWSDSLFFQHIQLVYFFCGI